MKIFNLDIYSVDTAILKKKMIALLINKLISINDNSLNGDFTNPDDVLLSSGSIDDKNWEVSAFS